MSKITSNEHIKLEISDKEIDSVKFKKYAIYQEIKDYVMKKYGFKVSTFNIAQLKRKHGLIERKNYNVSKDKNYVAPKCPEDKERATEEALEWFNITID